MAEGARAGEALGERFRAFVLHGRHAAQLEPGAGDGDAEALLQVEGVALRELERELSGLLNKVLTSDSGINKLSDIGISINASGKLELKSSRLDAALENPTQVKELLNGGDSSTTALTGVMKRFRKYADSVLGTDGYGRSDTRANLRRHFEVDRFHVAHAAVAALAADGKLTAKDVARAIKLYKLDPEKQNPLLA